MIQHKKNTVEMFDFIIVRKFPLFKKNWFAVELESKSPQIPKTSSSRARTAGHYLPDICFWLDSVHFSIPIEARPGSLGNTQSIDKHFAHMTLKGQRTDRRTRASEVFSSSFF